MKPGARNLITDVPGIAVGNVHDEQVLSGVSVILPDERCVAAVDARGGGPGTRETDALDPANLVDEIDAITLSGGSVFGLDAASGVTAWLAGEGRGFVAVTGAMPSPIVPAAILYDLNNNGAKDWGAVPPYRAMGIKAAGAAGQDFTLGSEGAGYGAMAGTYKGGLGSASAILESGATIGALVAVNSFGAAVMPNTNRFWAAPFALGGELGDGAKASEQGFDPADLWAGTKAQAKAPGHNTTIGVVATDIALTPAQAQRVAIMAQDGYARALRPVHTPFDGDIIFVLSTAKRKLEDPTAFNLSMIGAVAADVVARSVARGVYEAQTIGAMTSYRDHHGLN